MNIVRHKVYVVEFDVWEPQDKFVQAELDDACRLFRNKMVHAGNLKIVPQSEERTDAETR